MSGTERRRHCSSCDRDVHDLSALRETEAQALLMVFQSSGLCVRYATDENGEILHLREERTSSTVRRLSAARSQIGAGVVAMTLGSSIGCGPAPSVSTKPAAEAGSVIAPATASPSSPSATVEPAKAQDPPRQDTDRDGIPDSIDVCPYEPGPPSDHGCPPRKTGLVAVTNPKIEILTRIFFGNGSRKLAPITLELLEEVANVLRTHPDIKQIAIEGHAAADEPQARQLSEERARAVLTALVNARVEPSRLVVIGYGHERPVRPNTSRDNRARNRRVEFTILERSCSRPEAYE